MMNGEINERDSVYGKHQLHNEEMYKAEPISSSSSSSFVLYVVRLSMICQQCGHEKKKRIRIKKVAILLSVFVCVCVCMFEVSHLGASIVIF
jgi:hypothetical protein